MKLLHTSDWHLGQSLNQFDRSYEHEQFLAWLLDTLEAEQIDALLIAGDVFDNTNPSAASQAQLYQFLSAARQRVAHLSIVLIAGNHDSPGRLEAPASLLRLFNTSVVGVVGQTGRGDEALNDERLVVPLKDAAGQVAAWCIAMPFLRPSDLPKLDGAADAYASSIHALYDRAYAAALRQCQPDQAIVAMGHCHTTGGTMSEDSERRIVIGGAQALPASVFDAGIAYVALGHLHLAQKVGGDPTRRYSGSPLPLSFSEVDYPHQVVVVELDGSRVAEVREVRIPRSVSLMRIPKDAKPLAEVLAQLEALELPTAEDGAGLPLEQWPFLQVRVLLDKPEPGLRAAVETALTGKAVRLVRIETSSVRGPRDSAAPLMSVDELGTLAPTDFFERLYQHRFNEPPPADLLAAFTELANAQIAAGALS